MADGPVVATADVPPSKSQTNRALVLAALAEAPSTIRSPLGARDTVLMADALRALGATIEDEADDWHVTPGPIQAGGEIDCGLAGTVMRFVPPVATLAADGPTCFDGDPRARLRPMRPLVDALRALGAHVEDTAGGLPLTVYGGGSVSGGGLTVDASASSQVVSALLLTAPRWPKGVEVRHVGPRLPSRSYISMTIADLRAAGVEAEEIGPDAWRVVPGPISGRDVALEPDLANAAPFLAAAAVTGGRITVPGWPEHTWQPTAVLPELLATMGARVRRNSAGLTVEGDGLDGIDADLSDASELLTVVAALAALARTPSRLTGVAHVRGHETDRIAALAAELTALGGDATELPDGVMIRPRALHGGVFRTYEDHRLATAAAVLGLVVPGIAVENVGTTAKTMPDFIDRWLAMLGHSRPDARRAG